MEGVNGTLNLIKGEMLFQEAGIFLKDPFWDDGLKFDSQGPILPKLLGAEKLLIEESKGLFYLIQVWDLIIINDDSINRFPAVFLPKEVEEKFGTSITKLQPPGVGPNHGPLDLGLLVSS